MEPLTRQPRRVVPRPAAASAPKLTHILLDWIAQSTARELQVTIGDSSIKVTKASKEEQAKLINAWIEAAQNKATKK